MTTNISDRAMLVSLSISAFSGRKHDKGVSDEVAADKKAASGSGRYNKNLLPKEALAPIGSVVSDARIDHYKLTLPWLDTGARILPAAIYFDYMAGQRAHKARFESEVRTFLDAYPAHCEAARRALGDLYRESDYPAPSKLARAFAFSVDVAPMPAAEDFRVNLSDAEVARVRADIEARSGDALAAASADLWARIADVVGKMSERLRAYSVDPDTGKASGVFRDSLVGNVRELVDVLPKLNLTGDAALDAVVARMRSELCDADAADLRESEVQRDIVAASADSILAAMASYCGEVAPMAFVSEAA